MAAGSPSRRDPAPPPHCYGSPLRVLGMRLIRAPLALLQPAPRKVALQPVGRLQEAITTAPPTPAQLAGPPGGSEYAECSNLSQLPATTQEVGSKFKRVSYTFPLPSIGVQLGLNLAPKVQSWVQSLAAPGLSARGNPGGVRLLPMPTDPLAPLVAAVFHPAAAPHPCRLRPVVVGRPRPLVRLPRRLMPPSPRRYLPGTRSGTRGPGPAVAQAPA